jgi:hypothetical protein
MLCFLVMEGRQVRCVMMQLSFANCSAKPGPKSTPSLNRTVYLMIGIAAVFELFTVDTGTKMTIAGFQFGDVRGVQAILPVVVAYLYFEVMLLAKKYEDTALVYSKIIGIAYPGADANNLDLLLQPPTRALVNAGTSGYRNIAVPSERVAHWVRQVLSALVIFLPLAFEVYAFWVMFRDGRNAAFVWAALVVVIAFVTGTWVFALSWGAEYNANALTLQRQNLDSAEATPDSAEPQRTDAHRASDEAG